MMGRVGSDSGWPEEYHIQMIVDKSKEVAELREKQFAEICEILDTMPTDIRRNFYLRIAQHYGWIGKK